MKSQSLKKELIGLIIGFIGIMVGCFVVRLFNQYVLMLILTISSSIPCSSARKRPSAISSTLPPPPRRSKIGKSEE